MNILERQHIQAELTELSRLLKQMPEDDVIDRMILEYRKTEVEEMIASQPSPTTQLT